MLPIEIYAEIFQYLPNQRRISKLLNQHNATLFYKQFSQLPIQPNEILNYLNQYRHLFLFEEFNEYTYIYKITKYSSYNIYQYKLEKNVLYLCQTIQNSNVECIYRLFSKNNIYYDLITTLHVMNNRHINPSFAKDYIFSQFTYQPLEITNLKVFHQALKKIVYIDINYIQFTCLDEIEVSMSDIIDSFRSFFIKFNGQNFNTVLDQIKAQNEYNYYIHYYDYIINYISKNY